MPGNSLLIKIVGLPHNNFQRVLRALADAVAQAVAESIGNHPRLAFNNGDGAFGAGAHAVAAAIAALLIYLYNVPLFFHPVLLSAAVLVQRSINTEVLLILYKTNNIPISSPFEKGGNRGIFCSLTNPPNPLC